MTSSISELRQSPAQEMICFPASFAQQRLWFIDQLTPGRATYNLPSALRVRGKLDVEVLERTLEEVTRRHETLRTRFVSIHGEPQQVIEDHVKVQLPVVDLTSIPGKEKREAEAVRLAQEEARQPFDLKQAPLMRGKLLRLGELNHVLLFTMHHIISDAWSMGVLIEEVSVLYDAFSAGRPSPLPELPIQYADYTVWQREWLEGGVLEEQLAYWKQQLGGGGMLQLPTDRPRPTSPSQNGAMYDFEMDANLTQKLQALAEEQGATLFMVLLAAFQTLLYRYSGQDDIAVGTPTAGRSSGETEKLIGFFINTLVLRGDLSGAPSFTELLQRTKEVTLEAYAHEDVPFEKLVEVLSPERNLGSTPFFQVMIVMQNAPQFDLRLGAATLQPFNTVDNGTSKFDLLLQLGEDGSGKLTGSLQYDMDLFDAAFASRFIDHYRRLLSGIAVKPSQSINVLPLLSTNERKQVIEEWNCTAAEFSRGKCVLDLIEEQAAKRPGASALQFKNEQLSYAELNTRANQLARRLRELGVGLETRVGLLVERSIEMVVGLLAVMKAGAAYVPLDPDYPGDRLSYMLESSQVKVLLTQERLRQQLSPYGGQVLELDGAEEQRRIAEHKSTNLNVAVLPENSAYIIYTSGSTGRPKGVVNTHGGLLNRLLWMQEEYRLEPGDVVLQKTPFSFDVSVWEFFWPLMEGAKLVMARPGGHKDPSYLATLIEEQQVTTLHFVPSMLAVFLDEKRLKQCKSLRRVVCSGEALPQELARRCLVGMPWAELHNLYGPTEAAIDVTYWKCLAEDAHASVPIGKPIANIRVYVVDEAMEPVPVGVPGELLLAGVGLARGYWGRGDLTAERFLPDGLSGRSGERVYRTGDLARWLPDGNIEYLGRLDQQVKIRGFRIELGEIEAALKEHVRVREAVVMAREDGGGDKRLVAYVVPRIEESNNGNGATELRISELQEHLRGKLPEYMVPSAYVQLEKLPLNHNGKIDRKKLPQPGADTPEQEYIGPRNFTEETLCQMWQEVLRRERVGIHDNFFRIGGHSLMAAQLVTRIRGSLRVDIPLRRMFESPTIAQLAEVIDQIVQTVGANGAASHPRPALKQVARKTVLLDVENISDRFQPAAQEVTCLPASFAQQRLWFIDQLTPGRATYNIPGALRIQGELDVEVLKRALKEVVRRHETLRTRFATVHGEPQQVIEEQVKVQLPVLDLTSIPGEKEREAEAMRLARQEAQQPFDLRRAPLMRGKLLRLGELNHVLLFTMHHIISDGWSAGVLIEEVTVLYGAFSTGQASPLPELPIQYADYSMWQREWLEGGVLEEQLAYWKKQLGGSSMLQLPTDRPRLIAQGQDGAASDFVIAENTTQQLKKLAEEQGATLFMVLLAAFQTLLYRYSGQHDIAVGTPVAGRGSSSETEKLIGFFINTLVLRADFSGVPSFMELLHRTKEVTLEAYAHQDVPFERLVEVLSPERNLGSTPLFQTMITLGNVPQSNLRLGSAVLQPFGTVDNGTSKFELSLLLGEDGSGMLAGSLQYNTDLFDAVTINRMIGHYSLLLSSIIADPHESVHSLEMLNAEERRMLLEDYNATAAPIPEKTVIVQFEEQVDRTPMATAVQCGEDALSYQELDQRANQLAHHLKEMGVRAEMLVGICLNRSLDMVVALLGVLKSGAAYVPLDPSYPMERLGFMLQDAQIPVLVTESSLRGRFAMAMAEIVSMDEDWQGLSVKPTSRLESNIQGSNLAYVIYTSGSTGRPKGVAVTHHGMINYVNWAEQVYRTNLGSGSPVHSSLAFDLTVTSIYPVLQRGGRLEVLSQSAGMEELAQRLETSDYSLLKLTPSHLRMLSLLLEKSGKGEQGARALVIGGEALKYADLESWRKPGSKTRLINEYGPTETVVGSTIYEVQEESHAGEVPVGKPIANTEIYVLDTNLQVTPVGLPGELYIGGAGLARGYVNRSGLTADRFIPNPYRGPGARMYRTGDLARWRNDGNLEYLGRNDQQVKIRGFRIELGEIETALQEHDGVQQAVVIAREDQPGEKRLVAYVVPEARGDENEREKESRREELRISRLREYLQGKFPEYMVPSAYVLLEKLPLNHNGKIDRKKLPQPDENTREQEYVGPRNPTEETLCRLWQEVLRVERVGVQDNFFTLGGHSLLAVQVISRIKSAFAMEMPLSVLFAAPTVARMAEHIAATNRPGRPQSSPVLVNIQPHGPSAPFFCVHPVGGQVISYGELSRELGLDQPFYGLQSPPANFFPETNVSIEQMAALYIREIRSVQPVGPYLLGGWSMGGLVAWEMAQQLAKEDETIGLLALIDTTPPPKYLEADDRASNTSMLALFALDMSRLVGRDPRPLAEQFSRAAAQDQWNMVQEALISYGVLTPKTAHAEMTALLDTFTRNSRAIQNYSLQQSQQRVVYFRASESLERFSKAWTRWASGGIEYHSVPGDHFTMLREPGVRNIAELLQAHILNTGEQPHQVSAVNTGAATMRQAG
jgi:amino acid adenylation domain-containing protein